MISGPSIVVDVDTDADGLAEFVESLRREYGDDCESIFVCEKGKRAALDWLYGSHLTVLVPPAGSTWSRRINQALAVTSGDPIVVAAASRPFRVGQAEAVEAFLREHEGGIVVRAESSAELSAITGLPTMCRRAFDTLGALLEGDSPTSLVTDYLARATVAGIPAGSIASRGRGDSDLAAVELSADDLALARAPYAGCTRPLVEQRCLRRDHIRHEPVRRMSFAFVTHNRLGYLEQTWNGLFAATPELRDLECEFVFADNGSDADVREWLLDRDAWIVFNPENRGIPIARNQALALTTGDPIVMVDPDILLPEGWFSRALDVLSVPGIGFSAVSEEDHTYEVVEIEGVEVEVKRGNIAGVWIIPRSTIDILGFFNEEYQFYGGEDSDYGQRIMVAGMANTYLPHMKGVHLGAEDGVYSEKRTEYVEMKAKWWDINMALFQRRAHEYANGQRPLRVERVSYRY